MRTALKVAVATLIGCGALLLALGVVIWTGNGDRLIPLHVAIGVVLVLTLWTVCGLAARSGVATGTVAAAAAWGVLVVVLGLIQEELIPGELHWTIQVLHVLISMGAIWWGRRLVGLIARARSAAAPGSMQHASVTS
jgi:hypothetical protein